MIYKQAGNSKLKVMSGLPSMKIEQICKNVLSILAEIKFIIYLDWKFNYWVLIGGIRENKRGIIDFKI